MELQIDFTLFRNEMVARFVFHRYILFRSNNILFFFFFFLHFYQLFYYSMTLRYLLSFLSLKFLLRYNGTVIFLLPLSFRYDLARFRLDSASVPQRNRTLHAVPHTTESISNASWSFHLKRTHEPCIVNAAYL